MKTHIIGRQKELLKLEQLQKSEQSEFIAVYGRRRVGKTFLIREYFNNNFAFQISGLAKASTKEQLINFNLTLKRISCQDTIVPKSWMEAFEQLIAYVEKLPEERKVIFIDEMPWLDTPRSKFIQALEHFWNGWASARYDIVLIVCGSSTSWMIDKVINNHGGLHNRLTCRMKLEPFTLKECKEYFDKRNFEYSLQQIAECYMAMGGIPYYLSMLSKGLSVSQNLNNLFFEQNAPLKTEFGNLYAALFRNSEDYIAIVETLSKKMKGLSRYEIIRGARLTSNGNLTKILKNLENCGFIRSYNAFGKKERDKLYQLTDFYSLFYYKFISENKYDDEQFWTNSIDTPLFNTWAGYAFKMLCLNHIKQIKAALGISGVQSPVSSWRSSDSDNGAQVDLVIDRKDKIINLCEMKYASDVYIISKAYESVLKNKMSTFRNESNTKKAIHLTFVTTYGIKHNQHSEKVQSQVILDNLFD